VSAEREGAFSTDSGRAFVKWGFTLGLFLGLFLDCSGLALGLTVITLVSQIQLQLNLQLWVVPVKQEQARSNPRTSQEQPRVKPHLTNARPESVEKRPRVQRSRKSRPAVNEVQT